MAISAADSLWRLIKMSKAKKHAAKVSIDVDYFSAAERVGAAALMDALECYDNGRYFEMPINARDLIGLLAVGVHHNSALHAKLNILTSTFKPTPLMTRSEFKKLAFNYLVLGNGYLEVQRNLLGRVLGFQSRLALYMRRASNLRDFV